ncbi:MAG: hypothetical protein JOZ04_14100 [Acidimicrobiia bacterium]|nr:hypothetical protein [Acidimicrobiia bacterium]
MSEIAAGSATPSDEELTLADEEAEPGDEGSKPAEDELAPSGVEDELAPSGDEPIASDDGVTAPDEEATPPDEDLAPSDEDLAPSDEEPNPAENPPTGAAPEEDAKAPSRTAFRAAVALAIVLFVGTIVAVVFAAQQHRQLQQSKDARAGVDQVASRFASAVLTYDYRNLDQTKQAVLALSTGKFRTDYDQNFGGLSALFTATKGQSTATVKDVFVSGIQNDTATAIVVLDERGQGTSGQRLNVDWYLRLSLVKVNGNWRVDDLINLNFAGQGASPVPDQSTPATTPTTAPPK